MTPITITIRKDGPYSIVGDDVANVRLVDADGNVIQPRNPAKMSLCRCGASSTKPFCDGTHSRIGFKAAEEAAQQFDATAAKAEQPK